MREGMDEDLFAEAADLVRARAMREVLALASPGPVDEQRFREAVEVYETACDLKGFIDMENARGTSQLDDRVFGQIMPVRQFLGDGAGEQAMACHLLYQAAREAADARSLSVYFNKGAWGKALDEILGRGDVAESAWAAIRDDMARNDGVSMEFFGEDQRREPHGPQELSMTFGEQDLADWGVDVGKVADVDGLAAEWVDMMYDELVDKSNLPYVALVRALENKGYDLEEVFRAEERPAVLKRSHPPTQAIDLNEEDLVTEGVDLAKVSDPASLVRRWKESVADRVYEDGDLRHNTLLDALSGLGIDPAGVMAAPAPAREEASLEHHGDQGRWAGAQEAFDVIAQARDNGRASGVYADMDSGLIWADQARSIPDLPKYDDPSVVEVQHYDVGDVIDPPEELEVFADEALEAERSRGYTLTPGQVAGIEEAIKTVYGSWSQALGHAPRPLSSQCGAAVRAVERDDEYRGSDRENIEGEIGGRE